MTTNEMIAIWTGIMGAVTGIVGMVTGLIALAHQIGQTKVKLRVIPMLGLKAGATYGVFGHNYNEHIEELLVKGAPSCWCVEIFNESAFPVTINIAGFGHSRSTRRTMLDPKIMQGTAAPENGKWPVKLEPQTSVIVGRQWGHPLDDVHDAYGFATTDGGRTYYGKSKILRDHVKGKRKITTTQARN